MRSWHALQTAAAAAALCSSALHSGAFSRKCMVGVAGKYSGCGGATDSNTMASTECADGEDVCVLVTVCGQSLMGRYQLSMKVSIVFFFIGLPIVGEQAACTCHK